MEILALLRTRLIYFTCLGVTVREVVATRELLVALRTVHRRRQLETADKYAFLGERLSKL